MKEASHQKHGGASSVDVGKDGDQDGTKEGSSSREAVPDDSKNETITDLSNVSFRANQLHCLLTRLNSVTTEACLPTGLKALSQKRIVSSPS